MFTVHTIDKELTLRKYKQLITLTIKKKTSSKDGQKICTDTSQKQIDTWSINTRQTHHHYTLGK